MRGMDRQGTDATVDADADERRPPALVFVYTWDIVRAILAIFAALGSFSGTRRQNGRDVGVPVGVQVLEALAAGALAIALFLIGTLLTRRAAWVRRAQVIVLVMAIILNGVTVTVAMVTDETARDLATGLVSGLLVLVDILVVFVMTSPRMKRWFSEPGVVPIYLGGLVAFWAAASGAFFVLGLRS